MVTAATVGKPSLARSVRTKCLCLRSSVGRRFDGRLSPLLSRKDALRGLQALGSSTGNAKSRLFRPPLIPFCEHRDLVHCSASDDVQRLLVATREGQVVGIPRYGNGAQVLALWAEDLDARRRCRIHAVLAVDCEAVPPKSDIGCPV